MATDLATLGITVETSELTDASSKLEQFAQKAREAGQSADDAGKKSKDAGGGFASLRSEVQTTHAAVDALVGAFGEIAALAGIGFGIHEFISAIADSDRAYSQLQAGIQSTGGAAGYTADQLRTLAQSIQQSTAYSHVQVEQAQAILLTFTRIGHDVFPEATRAVTDLSTRMGGDLTGAALQLGKALNDPLQGMTALRREGVQFSGAQQEIIKQLVDSGRLFEAQNIILQEMQREFGGSAEAARDTLGGALQSLKNTVDDLFESTGEGGLGGALKLTVEQLNDFVKGAQDASTEAGHNLAEAVFTAADAVSTLYRGISDTVGFIEAHRTAFELLAIAIGGAGVFTGVGTVPGLALVGAGGIGAVNDPNVTSTFNDVGAGLSGAGVGYPVGLPPQIDNGTATKSADVPGVTLDGKPSSMREGLDAIAQGLQRERVFNPTLGAEGSATNTPAITQVTGDGFFGSKPGDDPDNNIVKAAEAIEKQNAALREQVEILNSARAVRAQIAIQAAIVAKTDELNIRPGDPGYARVASDTAQNETLKDQLPALKLADKTEEENRKIQDQIAIIQANDDSVRALIVSMAGERAIRDANADSLDKETKARLMNAAETNAALTLQKSDAEAQAKGALEIKQLVDKNDLLALGAGYTEAEVSARRQLATDDAVSEELAKRRMSYEEGIQSGLVEQVKLTESLKFEGEDIAAAEKAHLDSLNQTAKVQEQIANLQRLHADFPTIFSASDLTAQVDKLNNSLAGVQDRATEIRGAFENAFQDIGTGLERVLTDASTGAKKNIQKDFFDLGKQLEETLLKSAVFQPIEDGFKRFVTALVPPGGSPSTGASSATAQGGGVIGTLENAFKSAFGFGSSQNAPSTGASAPGANPNLPSTGASAPTAGSEITGALKTGVGIAALGFGKGGASDAVSATSLNSAGAELNTAGATLNSAGASLTSAAASLSAAATKMGVSGGGGSSPGGIGGIGGILGGGGGAGAGGSGGDPGDFGDGADNTFHTGGIVGQGPKIFEMAKRYHNGGIAGDEVPIIAKRGERILSPGETEEYDKGSRHVTNLTMHVHGVTDADSFRKNQRQIMADARRAMGR